MTLSTVVFEDTASVYGAYEQGRCDATTSDKSQLAAIRSTMIFRTPATEAELATAAGPVAVVPDLDTTADIDGVTALVSQLDAVICPSSTLGWVGAAVGVPVWLLYNTPVFLEYGTDRFPGFPSVRCFRKIQIEPWRPLMVEVGQALKAHLGQA